MFSKRVLITIGGFFLIACCVILISVSSKHPAATENASRLPISMIAPFQDMSTGFINALKNVWRHYFYLVETARRNDVLNRDLRIAKAKNDQCMETERTNQRLRSFLNFQKAQVEQMVAAEVIGRDPSPWFKTVIIDKGTADGVEKGMPVLVPEGIAGQVMAVSAKYAKVLLVIDHNSSVDALVQRTRARGIIQGKSEDRCAFQYVLSKNDVSVGDAVISSGLDSVYPKGLKIGYVSNVVRRNAGIFQDVEVTPSVDFEKLEEVLVILNHSASEFTGN